MERWLQLLVLFLGLLLVNTDAKSQNKHNDSSITPPPTNTTKSATVLTPPPTFPSTKAVVPTAQTSPELAVVKVNWTRHNPCKGALYLTWKGGNESVCSRSQYRSKLVGLCYKKKCGHFQGWVNSESVTGLHIYENGTITRMDCMGLHVQCTGCSEEVVAYKVVTGLLLVLVLGVLLLRFGKPTYNALRKRLSQRQQSRWIGPTQSQSVHYNREQQAGLQPNNNTFKRHSYPAALEKLTVASSREPSSNRNSDYSYN